MRMILAVAAVLYSASAFAQADKPPMIGDKPLVQVRPKGTKAGTKEAAAKPAAAPKGQPQSFAARRQACLGRDDGTRDWHNCYDGVLPPTPKPKPAKAKCYADCRFFKEED